MVYAVTITSQGQVTIPADIRRLLGLNKSRKAQVVAENGAVVIRPVRDIMEFAGAFKTKKKFSAKKIREGFGDYLARRAISGLK